MYATFTCIAAPASQKPIHNYVVMISEEDGDIDIDLPRDISLLSICVHVHVFVGRCLATKLFIGKLPATGGVWVVIE